jgi:cytoskeleton protein RodZ
LPAPPVIITVPAPPPVVLSIPSAGQAQAAQPPTIDAPRPDVQEATAPPATPAVSTPDANAIRAPVKIDTPLILRNNSWVELRSPSGDVLAQTYVRAGESYVVPAGIGYRVIDAH